MPSKKKSHSVPLSSEGSIPIGRSVSLGSDAKITAALTLLAVFVRLYRISYPTSVVFDEVHFGGFASKYIKGKFFMDVHPPLAKMLIALTGWLAGFQGDFDFKDIGKSYVDLDAGQGPVPYVAMRLLPAVMGIMLVGTTFLALRAANVRKELAILAAGLVCFENGLVTQSRLILLDSPLIIFTGLTALSFQKFTALDENTAMHFSSKWWRYLVLTGLFLGATVSVKWVGLFTIAWVGTITVFQLFVHLGNLDISFSRVLQHFFARAFALIALPVVFYMAMFAIHFQCLVNPGDGDGFMSSEFQATLNNNAMESTLAPVSFGSKVTIKHLNTQGGYLHSHAAVYPGGSNQQQITLYPHKDANNDWILLEEHEDYNVTTEAPVQIEDGAVIKLWHPLTRKRLHSHDVRPIVTEVDWQNEASAYGFEGFDGDANDLFRIEIHSSTPNVKNAKTHVRAIETKFRLIHVMTGCALFSHKVKLPSWGFEQQEVTCAKQGTIPNSLWYVESNEHENASPEDELITYRKLGFLAKFWELNIVMWKTNAGLLESHNWDSRPPSWPTLRRGINFWGRDRHHIYLIGNILVWGLGTFSVFLYLAGKALAILRWQRGYNDYKSDGFLYRSDLRIGTWILGWAFHYLPFYLMQRQLFLHHYFPALWFSILGFTQILEYGIASLRLSRPLVIGLVAMTLLATVSVFSFYAPLAYGLNWQRSTCEKSKLVSTWDFDCSQFPESYAEYAQALPAAGGPRPTDTTIPPVQAKPVEQLIQPEVPVMQSPKAEHTIFQDEAGNILDPEEVAKMQNVKFVTQYANELPVGLADQIKKDEQKGDKPGVGDIPEYAQGMDPETIISPGTEGESSHLKAPVDAPIEEDVLNDD